MLEIKKDSKRGSTTVGTRFRYPRRKTLIFLCGSFLALFAYNYVSLSGQLSTSIESKSFRSSEKSTIVWENILRNETASSRLGIHVLRPGTSMDNVIVLGERHSGTTFFTKYLADCFPNTKVGDSFVNRKHWMQHDPDYLHDAAAGAAADESTQSLWREIAQHGDAKGASNTYFENSLVLILIRNPYDWVEAMRRRPWHWPNHIDLFALEAKQEPLNIKAHKEHTGTSGGHSVEKSLVGHNLLEWKEFVQRPLYLIDEQTEAAVESSSLCQMGYPVHTVTPCRKNQNYVPVAVQSIPKAFLRHLPYDTNNPVYEHNPLDGKPFANLMELRATKLRNLLALPEKWELGGIGFLQYDNLLGDGLKSLADEIGSYLGSSSSCPVVEPFEKTIYNFTAEYRNWIAEAVQWDVENLIGYHKHES